VTKRVTTTEHKPGSLLLLEGDTEQIFYSIIRDEYLKNIKVALRNIHGQGNINKDILSEIFKYSHSNPQDIFHVYCCMDTEENKTSATPLDIDLIRKTIVERNMRNVLSLNAILANPEIESWFFYDIEGIYKFLRVKKSLRKKGKFNNPKYLCKKDLKELFHRFEKEYVSGNRANNFIEKLNISRIISNCTELNHGLKLIKHQAKNNQNLIF